MRYCCRPHRGLYFCMKSRKTLIFLLSAGISLPAPAGVGQILGPSPSFPRQAHYRIDRPGLLLQWPEKGESLQPGTYRYRFSLRRLPGNLPGILSSANDAVRLEVFDLTTNERIASRTIQQDDLANTQRGKTQTHSVIFSSWGRENHHLQARVYWPGLTGISVDGFEREDLGSFSYQTLREKSQTFKSLMEKQFIDEDGYVVVRDASGQPADYGDTALWTGYYAATLAWEIHLTQNPEACKKLERSLWALHRLHEKSPVRGTLIRHAPSDGRILIQPSASRDTYTGFYVAVAQGLPYVKDAALKRALLSDLDAITGFLLDNDWQWKPRDGNPLDLRSVITPGHVQNIKDIHTLFQKRPQIRGRLTLGLRLTRWYFRIQGLQWPEALVALENALRKNELDRLPRLLPPALDAIRIALKELRHGIDRSAAVGRDYGIESSPYQKLERWLDLVLLRLGNDPSLRVLPTQALHALHALKVAGECLPKPNRFERAYRENLRERAGMLTTLESWDLMHEAVSQAVLGETRANAQRTTGGHLSPLLLFDLLQLEKDAAVRFSYRDMIHRRGVLHEQDLNALMEILDKGTREKPAVPGLALWVLARYPEDRSGRGLFTHQDKRALASRYGGMVEGKSREALPPDFRPRDAFLWQRNPRSLEGDAPGWQYPPLDFLMAYWLARLTGENTSPIPD